MKRWMVFSLVAVLLATGVIVVRGQESAGSAKDAAPGSPVMPGLTSENDKVSYAYGAFFAMSLKMRGADDLNPDLVGRGFKDMMNGKPQLSSDEMKQVLTTYTQKLQAKAAQFLKDEGAKNLAEGEAFLAKNKTQPGVVTTASGLQYKVLQEGTGPTPKGTDTVSVKYKGSFINGTVFDASDLHHGDPVAHFQVDQVISGWTEGLQLMKVGSKYELFIPPDLAYGPNGRGAIPPSAVLIFQVELVGIDNH